jgi:hypothetical protein
MCKKDLSGTHVKAHECKVIALLDLTKKGMGWAKVAGHIPARISDVPSWDAEIVFL